MTDKQLKRLSRAELLEMLLAQVKENEQLKTQLAEMQKKLDDKKIMLGEAGSIAEAAMQLNGVFQTAESAAEQYLENIRRLTGEQEDVCRRMEEEALKKAEAIRREAEAVRRDADNYSSQIRSRAKEYQKEVEQKVQSLQENPDGTYVSRRSRRRGRKKK